MEYSTRNDRRRRKRDGATDQPTTRPPSKNMKTGTDFLTPGHQNDVIDVSDDEAERHSALSTVKREEEEPSRPTEWQLRQELIMVKRHSLDLEHKLLNFEQQVAMKDGMLKRERRATHEAELRADRAEKLLESQAALVEVEKGEMEKQVSDLTEKLKKKDERICDLKKELEEEREERKRAEEKITELESSQLEKEKEEGSDESIDELKRKLAAAEVARRKIHPRIYDTADQNNIISLLGSKVKHAMSIDEAVEKVRAEYKKCGNKAKKRLEEKWAYCDCDVCGVELRNKLIVTTHFLSEEHIEKVRPHNASVSGLAVKNWAGMLNNFSFW